MNIKNLPRIVPNENTLLLGVNSDGCLGTIDFSQLADLVCKLCGAQDSSIMSFEYGGLNKCAPESLIHGYGLDGFGFGTENIDELAISFTDAQGHDLEQYLLDVLTIGTTIKLTNSANPTDIIVFEVTGALDVCNASYTVPVIYISGGELSVGALYTFSI